VAKNVGEFKYDPTVCSFKSWMLQVTRWRILNQLKKREVEAGRRVPASASTDQPASELTSLDRIPDPQASELEAIWEAEWESNLLSAALERVKRRVEPAQFQIFDLYCLEGWPVWKVAQTLGVGVGRVYLAKHRVGQLLKKEVAALRQGTV
jgi:RNA polymerase sigma-70 factor (ECF subfamily)